MSSWRQREIEKARLRKEAAARAEEEARLKSIQKTETNFPSMTARAPQQTSAASFGTSFSSMAQKWATDEKIEKTMEEYRAQKAAKAARDNAVHGVVLMPVRRRPLADVYEEDEEPEPAPAPSEDDWTEVRNSKVKAKRELTTYELEQKARETYDEEYDDRDDEDYGTYGRPRSDW